MVAARYACYDGGCCELCAAGYGPFEPASNDLATALARLEAQQAELLQLLHAAQVSGF